MNLAVQNIKILPEGLPAGLVCALATAGVAVWIGAHFIGRRPEPRRLRALALAGVCIAVGFAALLMAAQAMQQWVVLATSWPLWPIALAGSLAVEAVLRLYGAERRTVSRAAGTTLAALRIALALLVLLTLAQPVFVLEEEHAFRRYVAVLADSSASMQVPDTHLSVPEKVRLAEALSAGVVARPYRLETVAQELESLSSRLATQQEWLAMLQDLTPDARGKYLKGRQKELHETLRTAEETARRQLAVLDETPQGPTVVPADLVKEVAEVRDQLMRQVSDRLQEGAAATAPENVFENDEALPELEARLREIIRGATDALDKLTPAVHELSRMLDETYYASLSEEQQAAIETVAGQTRLELARQVLFGRSTDAPDEGPGGQGLLGALEDEYQVRAYAFASEPSEMDLADRLMPNVSPPETSELQTDLAAALRRAMADIPGEQLAGVILLTDGRHNSPDRVEPLARRLGMDGVPICSIVFGSRRPPTDAAIVNVAAPATVYAADKVYVVADVKLDGLEGRNVTVTLCHGDAVVDSRTIQVPSAEYRTRVELSDVPAETGLLAYRVRVEQFEDEVLAGNNEFPLAVSVTQDQVRLLIIEDRPRWEFRYLKNLFASRDKTVKLQHVLFRPDRIAGQRERPRIRASTSRPAGEVEATALPMDEGEWLNFDVIILGDVPPSRLPLPAQEALHKFVADRGGTLVVIAGPRFMPHAFGGTPLEELLPIRFEPTGAEYVAAADEGFRIALTPEGRDSIITRLKADAEENAAFWPSYPEVRWRYPITGTKARAIVLAYADAGSPNASRQLQQQNALIVVHNAGLGRVVFMAFDRTWRLRYRQGDTYHHKLWGQLLRWATANKLPAGTRLVKLGTDEARYPLHSDVEVRAKIMRPDWTPLISNEVAALVFRDEQLVLRKKLQYIGDLPGMYVADLGELPSGAYRVELAGPDVEALLAEEDADKVSTQFSVDPATSTEQIELAADHGLPELLAELSGGIAVSPAQAARTLDALGPSALLVRDRKEYILWSSMPLLMLMILLATTEWLLRRKVGLP